MKFILENKTTELEKNPRDTWSSLRSWGHDRIAYSDSPGHMAGPVI